jgi:Fe-S cluster biogenesis protein NfuA
MCDVSSSEELVVVVAASQGGKGERCDSCPSSATTTKVETTAEVRKIFFSPSRV